MYIFTDNIEFAEKNLVEKPAWEDSALSVLDEKVRILAGRLFPDSGLLKSATLKHDDWNYLFMVKHAAQSQFEILIELGRERQDLPGGILCLAESGKKFHGFRNRPWVSLKGNIHLTAFLSPGQKVPFFHVGFTILSAVSVVQTIDTLKGLQGRASIKWVNDILIESSKVSGVIAHTLTQGEAVTGTALGIGMNVEATPTVKRDPFAPGVISLRNVLPDPALCNQQLVFNRLIDTIDQNYRKLLDGRYFELLDFYRKRSLIIGKNVAIHADPVEGEADEKIIRGEVVAIGDNLELYLKGKSKPVNRGRLVLE